jgi:hypothetical protein
MFGPCRAPGIELAGQALNKNAVALMPKNQWRLVQLTDCRRLPGAKSGDSNSYVFERVSAIPNTKHPGTVPPLRTRGFPYGLMTLFYLRAGYAEVILILDLPLLPAC